MRRRGLLPWLLCFGALSCAKAPPPVTGSAPPRAPDPSPPAKVPPTAPPQAKVLAGACALIESDWKSTLSEAEKDSEIDRAQLDALPSELGRCLDAGSGTWGVVLGSISAFTQGHPGSPVQEPGLLASPVVIFATVDGMTRLPIPWQHGFGRLELDLLVYDFNRDGTGELGLCHDVSFQVMGTLETIPERLCEVYRFDAQRRRIDAIAPIRVERLEDVDRDGAPDLISHAPFQILGHDYSSQHCSMCLDDDVNGPELVAHALPDGTFSRSDAVATTAARRGCPRRERASFPKKCDAREFARGWRSFACAVLQGEDRSMLRQAAEAARKHCCPDPSYCPEVDALDKWASVPPVPALLRSPP